MTREDQLAIVGEYVLGTMDDAERAAFEAGLRHDLELQKLVDDFSSSMQALDDTVDPIAVPETLWQAIESRIGTQSDKHAAKIVPADAKQRPLRRMDWGQWAAMAASVLVALGIGFFAGANSQSPAKPVVVAVLMSGDDASPGAIVEAFADDRVHIVPLEAFNVPEGKILQAWTLPDQETGPVSLGTFAASDDIILDGPSLPAPQNGQLYEITLEPAPGSPTGRPTGPILAKGFAKPIIH